MWAFTMWPFRSPQASAFSFLPSWVTLGLDFTRDEFRALLQSLTDRGFYSAIEELVPYISVFLLGSGTLYLYNSYQRKQLTKELRRVEMRDMAVVLLRQVQQTLALQQMLLTRLEQVEVQLRTLEEEKRKRSREKATRLQAEAVGSCNTQASGVKTKP